MSKFSIPDIFHFKGFAVFLIFALLVVAAGSCATNNKYKRTKAVPCPCETRYRR